MKDETLRERLEKLEALFRRAGSDGERAAAGAAMSRLQERLDSATSAEVELQFSLPDAWSVRLFVAVCRKHGVQAYRYARQRRTTVMVRVNERRFNAVVWPEFSRLQTELMVYFEETTDHLIRTGLGSDGDDSTLQQRQL